MKEDKMRNGQKQNGILIMELDILESKYSLEPEKQNKIKYIRYILSNGFLKQISNFKMHFSEPITSSTALPENIIFLN